MADHPHGWTPKKERALIDIFEGVKMKSKIAADLGINHDTLIDWMREPEFKQRLAAMREELYEHLEGLAFLRKEQRVIALSQLASEALEEWQTHRYEVETRPVPGGMLTNERLNKSAADIFRGALDDMAKELGERSTKVSLTAKIEQVPIQVTVVDLPPEVTARYLRAGEPVVDAEVDEDEEDEPLINIQPE